MILVYPFSFVQKEISSSWFENTIYKINLQIIYNQYIYIYMCVCVCVCVCVDNKST